MSFVEPVTIKEAVEKIHKKKFLLPAIQREFVWSTDQIERLFDSLMRDYPISSFLFWEVEKKAIENYQFYEFVKDFHERDNCHNPKAEVDTESDLVAVLDGQQRLTALYIGLKGTYAYKLPRKHWKQSTSFPKRKLCLNLLARAENEDMEYDFRFLTKEEYETSDKNHFWFVVCEILKLKEGSEINDYLLDKDVLSEQSKETQRFASRTLYKLYEVVHKNKAINFFLEKDESLDKVLNIFIRVNSGGTQLNYSDLLLSIATAQWKEKVAREEITKFVDEINAIGDGFDINKDFVLKNCLVLGDFKEIAFKVDNFNHSNMMQIERQWEEITNAIRAAFLLLSKLGYSRDTLTSNNAIIPIAYYLKKIGCPENFTESSRFEDERKAIFRWLIIVLLKRLFSGQPDNVLRPIREAIKNCDRQFPVEEIAARLKGTTKSMAFDNDEIENLLYYQYGQPYVFSILASIYPSLDFRNKFHQDHIFPKHVFTKSRLEKAGIAGSDIEFYLEKFNCLGNIQLLEGTPNQEKSGKDFKTWLEEKYPDKASRLAYMERHYIPDVDLSLGNFRQFFEAREKLLVKAFKKLFV